MPILMHSKQILLITILQLASLLNVCAQGALSSWLSPQLTERGRQYLFRRDILPISDIDEAFINVSAVGPFRLFVNGRVVYSAYDANGNKSYTIDVADYMRNDSNTVAVWCAPDINRPSGGVDCGMLALSFYGKYTNGRTFSCSTDSLWLCAPANVISSAYGEIIDAREYIPDWNMCAIPVQMKWSNAKETGLQWSDALSQSNVSGLSDYNIKVVGMSSFDLDDDGKTVAYNFGKAFWGTVRITVRDAKKGERILIDGSEYVCRGALDEQFVGRFVHRGIRKVVITGDISFRKSHVVKVEGLAMSPSI